MTKQQDLNWNKLEHFLGLVFTERMLASPTAKKNKHFEIGQTLVRTGRIPVVVITNTEVKKASIGERQSGNLGEVSKIFVELQIPCEVFP